MNRNLANKIVHFTKYDDSGKWLGNGIGKVVAIEKNVRIVVSIQSHPIYEEQELVSLYLWHNNKRYKTDVILKKE